MDHRLRPLALALALPLIVMLAACSSSGAGTSSAPSTAASASAPTTATGGGKYGSGDEASAAPSAAASEPAADGGGGIALADNALGKILVNGAGLTLYAFTPDSAGTPTCYDTCAQNWPPATGDISAGAGLDASLLTTVDRTDGSTQLKYGDWPLYLFAGDQAAGDTNGQGLNSKWYVIGADGKLIGQ